MINLTEDDLVQLKVLGLSETLIAKQVKQIASGTIPVILKEAATLDHGILELRNEQKEYYSEYFEHGIGKISVCHFIPASGAASRMFKSFFQFLENGMVNEEIELFAKKFRKFSFYDDIKCVDESDYTCAINKMINETKLPDLPKALMPFHSYKDGLRTALEEHIVESTLIQGSGMLINIHFTVSEKHQTKINDLLHKNLGHLESKLSGKINVSFSTQHESTDTISLDAKDQIARDTEGCILLRPGGHGSLLANLQDLDYELVFIKNIDNILPDHFKHTSVFYKKVLGGYLMFLQREIESLLTRADNNDFDLVEMENFTGNKLQIMYPSSYNSWSREFKVKYLIKKLDRPIRVCGMVKNEGEPGGGPFWVANSSGELSLQIVESSQIDLKDQGQLKLSQMATHFNPVDIVCWLKDYRSKKFSLSNFSEPDTAFVSIKTVNGKEIKILEHPGLWNGAMADWITVYVEVPLSTFSPVKTITDLLNPQHQPE